MSTRCRIYAGVCWFVMASLACAQSTPLPKTDQPVEKPLVDVSIRLIEVSGDLELPLKEKPVAPSAQVVNEPKVKSAGGVSYQTLTPVELAHLLEVCQADRRSNILAAPRLRLPVGEKGQLSNGVYRPYVVPQSENEETIESDSAGVKQDFFGTALDATVTIPKPGQLHLDLKVEHTELASVKWELGQRPGKNTTSVTTKLTCASGETVVLGGFHVERVAMSVEMIPVLSDLPVIGKSFTKVKHEKFSRRLLIVVTPELVDAAKAP